MLNQCRAVIIELGHVTYSTKTHTIHKRLPYSITAAKEKEEQINCPGEVLTWLPQQTIGKCGAVEDHRQNDKWSASETFTKFSVNERKYGI